MADVAQRIHLAKWAFLHHSTVVSSVGCQRVCKGTAWALLQSSSPMEFDPTIFGFEWDNPTCFLPEKKEKMFSRDPKKVQSLIH